MNLQPLILQLLTARLGGGASSSPLLALANGAASPAEMLSQLAQSENPSIAAAAQQMLAQQEGRPSVATEVRAPTERVTVVETEAPRPDERLRQLEDLAHALGACPTCWGRDESCRNCRGRGRPGFAIPDRRLFAEWIAPAIRTLRAQEGRSAGATPDQSKPTNGHTQSTQLNS